VVEVAHAGAGRLGREVNPVVMTKKAFQDKACRGDRFHSRVVKEQKIYEIGDAGELGKLVEDRAA
jgi:hypothetical protein